MSLPNNHPYKNSGKLFGLKKPFSPLDISPVAWYDPSDEDSIVQSGGAVSQLTDKSGNARHLTQALSASKPVTGTRTINSKNVLDFGGVPPTANYNTLAFDGATKYLTVNDNALLDVTDVTISLWVYANSGGANGAREIISKWAAGQQTFAIQYDRTTGALYFYISTTGSNAPSIIHSISLNDAWFHLAFTYDQVTMRMYINGAEVATFAQAGALFSSTSNVGIGARADNTLHFDGDISSPIVNNVALSGAQITELYNAGIAKQPWEHSDTIKASYALALPLNTGIAAGRELEDYSGNELDATAIASPTFTGQSLTFANDSNKFNAFDFTGTRYIDVGNDASVQISGSISMACLVYPTASGMIISKHAPVIEDGGYFLGYGVLAANKFGCQLRIGASIGTLTTTNTYSTGKWYHVALTFDQTDLKIYVDGVLDGTITQAGSLNANSVNTLYIGRDSNNGSTSFEGGITKPMIFNRALTGPEVLTLFNKNLPQDYNEIPSVITDDCVFAPDMSSNDNSLIDLSTSGNDGTAVNGATSDGAEINFDLDLTTSPLYLESTALGAYLAGNDKPFGFYAVHKMDDVSGVRHIFGASDPSNSIRHNWYTDAGFHKIIKVDDVGAFVKSVTTGVPSTNAELVGGIHTGVRQKAYSNASETMDTACDVGQMTTTKATIGARLNFGSTALPYDGVWAEIIITDGTENETTRQEIEAYLAMKWGLQTNLPKAHPYKLNDNFFDMETPAEDVGNLWQPNNLPNVEAWWDARDINSVEQETGVSRWKDKSGKENHLVQAVGANQPAYTEGVGITWDGLDDNLEAPSIERSSRLNLFMVRKSNDTSGMLYSCQAVAFIDPINSGDASTSLSANAGAFQRYVDGTVFNPSTRGDLHTTYNDNAVHIIEHMSCNLNNVNWDAEFQIFGYNESPTWWGNDTVYEVLVIKEDMTDADREKIEGYLAHKWGTAESLPSAHPYRYQAPRNERYNGVSKVWTPAEISVSAWYDPSDSAQVTDSGGDVSELKDKSGNDYHLTQAVGSAQPKINTRKINGLSALDYDLSAKKWLKNDNGLGNTLTGDDVLWEAHIVCKFDTDSASVQRLFNFANSGASAQLLFIQKSGANVYLSYEVADDTSSRASTTVQQFGTNTVLISVRFDGTNKYMYFNGVLVLKDTEVGTSVGTQTFDNFSLGAWYYDGSAQQLDGLIGEVLVKTQGNFTEEERIRIEGYLANKWGLTKNLPDSHPYKYDGKEFGYGKVWNPTKLGSKVASWYDPSDEDSITEAAGAVSEMKDKSGNSRHLVQVTGADQPVTGTRKINGLNVFDFNGATHHMSSAGAGAIANGTDVPVSIYVVSQCDVAALQYLAGFEATTSSNQLHYLAYNSANLFSIRRSNDLTLITDTNAIADLLVPQIASFNFDGVNGATYQNGSLLNSKAFALSKVANFEQFSIGNRHVGNQFNGVIGEVIILNGTESTYERQLIEGYLAWKWGTYNNLPVDHPYRWDGRKFGYGKLWTPEETIDNVTAWYDPANGSQITESAGAVSQLNDRSGNGYHLTQGTGADQPTVTTLVNGNTVLNFDETDHLENAALGTLLGPETVVEMYVVVDPPTAGFTRTVLTYRGGAPDYDVDKLQDTGSGYTWFRVKNLGPATATLTAGDDPIIIRKSLDNGNMQLGKLGDLLLNLPVSGGTTVFTNNFLLGDTGLAGMQGGNIYEVIISITSLNITEVGDIATVREKIEGYLAHKWGLTDLMLVTHPYKYLPPFADREVQAFQPDDLLGLQAWYDPADPTTITESTGVSQLDDKSGNGYHLTQGTGANQPTTGGSINGIDALDYNGTSHTLVNNDAGLASNFSGVNKAFSIYGVLSDVANLTAGYWAVANSSADFDVLVGGYLNTGSPILATARRDDAGIFSQTQSGAVDPSNPCQVRMHFDGTTGSIWGNGTQLNSADLSTGLGQTTADRFHVGSFRGAGNYLDGKMGEIIITDGTESEDTRQKIEGYLAHKWGLTAGLSVDHPYKFITPQRY